MEMTIQRRRLAGVLLLVLVAAAAYLIGRWYAVGIVIVAAVLGLGANRVWQIDWFKALERRSPIFSRSIKLTVYIILALLLCAAVVVVALFQNAAYFVMPIAK